MTGDQTVALVAAAGMLTLVGSSLLVRRLPTRTFVRLALVWLAIFVGLFALATKTLASTDDFT